MQKLFKKKKKLSFREFTELSSKIYIVIKMAEGELTDDQDSSKVEHTHTHKKKEHKDSTN